jgi:hypothetical protein
MKSPQATGAAHRRRLLRALAYALAAAASPAARGQLLGKVPRELPPGRSIYDLRGECAVNGKPAAADTFIGANDSVSTGDNSRLIFVAGKDAFLLRENSRMDLIGNNGFVSGLRLLAGAMLAVFGGGPHSVATPLATMGLRGTGLYVEARPDKTYVCICYGTIEIEAVDADERETNTSRHHDAPRYVLAAGEKRILPAPLINHTDQELALIEALVGRTPPFALFDSGYGTQKRY